MFKVSETASGSDGGANTNLRDGNWHHICFSVESTSSFVQGKVTFSVTPKLRVDGYTSNPYQFTQVGDEFSDEKSEGILPRVVFYSEDNLLLGSA